MADTRARRRGIWQFDRLKGSKDKQVYITCPGCGMVNGIGKHAVDKDGYIYDPKSSYTMGCIICIQCGTHFFVRLKDWKERRTK
jgi:RNase P subunit RPR2